MTRPRTGLSWLGSRHLFKPYSYLELVAIRLAGWPDQPTHFYEVLELRRTK